MSAPKQIAIIGGGRWARTLAQVLFSITPSETRFHLISPSNLRGWSELLQNSGSARNISMTSDILDVFENNPIDVALIARRARDNVETAVTALKHCGCVFIEKPFALTTADARRLVALSEGKICVTGLVFMFAPQIIIFLKAARQLGAFRTVKIEWMDPVAEMRSGEAKTFDQALNCLEDVFPHIWSITRMICQTGKIEEISAESQLGGSLIDLTYIADDVQFQVKIQRNATVRKRYIEIHGGSETAALDFSTEPGEARVADTKVDVTTSYESPLACQLGALIAAVNGKYSPVHTRIENAIEHITLTEALMPKIRQQQEDQIVTGLLENATQAERVSTHYALREILHNLRDGLPENEYQQSAPLPEISAAEDWIVGNVPDKEMPEFLVLDKRMARIKNRL